MTPLGHTGIALIIGLTATKAGNISDFQNVVLPLVIGGNFPDIDLLPRIFKKGIDFLDKEIGVHRNFITHTPFLSLLIFLFLSVLNKYLPNMDLIQKSTYFLIGNLLHLFLDSMFVPEGILLYYPISLERFNLLKFKTHKFWAPKQISGVNNWWINYLTSPLFWITEFIPSIISFTIFYKRFIISL